MYYSFTNCVTVDWGNAYKYSYQNKHPVAHKFVTLHSMFYTSLIPVDRNESKNDKELGKAIKKIEGLIKGERVTFPASLYMT